MREGGGKGGGVREEVRQHWTRLLSWVLFNLSEWAGSTLAAPPLVSQITLRGVTAD